MKQVIFDQDAAELVMLMLEVRDGNNQCHTCGNVVIPETLGGVIKLDGDTTGLFHNTLPCLIHMMSIMQANERSELER